MDPEYINVILTGKDSPTAGLINIISYDLMSKCIDVVKKKQFRVIIAVSWFLYDYSSLCSNYYYAFFNNDTVCFLNWNQRCGSLYQCVKWG